MNTKEISECLSSEIEILTNLRDTALEKQKALICSDGNGIEIYTYNEEQLLSELRKKESQRLDLLKKVSEEFQFMQYDRYMIKLSKVLAGKVLKEELDTIVSRENHLKNLVLQLKEINRQNQLLIQNSLEFINETIITLLGSNKKIIVDRKI
jgi:basic membrane lipoprotein Med (substrate-binding protein (PBP1-ABC) superfamily)